MKQEIAPKSSYLLPYLFALTGCFILFQIIFYRIFSVDGQMISYMISGKSLVIPWRIWLSVVFYCLKQLGLYFIFVLIVWMVTRLAAQRLKLSWPQTCRLGFVLWGLSVGAIILANRIFYPLSLFSKDIVSIFPDLVAEVILGLVMFLLFLAVILAVAQILRIVWRHKVVLRIPFVTITAVLIVFTFYEIYRPAIAKTARYRKPNIIIIGIDALRPDYVNELPEINKFISNSTSFSSSITPLAQTSPAWTSILTGQYPKHTGVRFAFASSGARDFYKTSLAAILQRQGYITIYGSDGRQFDAISKRYGFDSIIGASNGVDNYLLGTVNDFPLSNLILNSRLGELLFPYSYGNRSAYVTYEPETYVSSVARQLDQIKQRPIFLAIHLCLPHWPFVWAKSNKVYDISNPSQIREAYNSALLLVDKQFGNLMQVLRQNNLLDNAIVVVISDHGESLAIPGGRLIAQKNYIAGKFSQHDIFNKMMAIKNNGHRLDVAMGHGGDVLSWDQCNNVLAFRVFGKNKNIAHEIIAPVSLVDIKPTILEMLGRRCLNADGRSLLPYVKGEKIKDKPRMIFVESSFAPVMTKSQRFSLLELVKQTRDFFYIDQKMQEVLLNSKAAAQWMWGKQRAVYFREWVLALYPDSKKSFIPILVNRKSGRWTDDLETRFARNSPARKMLSALKNFFEDELDGRQIY